MEIKKFKGKRIKIRKISKRDLKNVKEFRDFINSLVEEGAQIQKTQKATLKEEKEWVQKKLKLKRKKEEITLVAEYKGKIISSAQITSDWERQKHVGKFGISVRQGYRGIGLGTYLTKKILKLAQKELKPPPKIIRLSVYSSNELAIEFYKKLGFKKVAKIPKQAKIGGKLVDEVIMLLEI